MLKLIKKRSIRPSQLVLVGDQLLIALGLISALFFFYRIINIKPLPDHTIMTALGIHICLGIGSWVVFGVYRKVIRFFNSKDYLNLLVIVFLIHTASSTMAQLPWFFPIQENRLKPEVYLISFFITITYIIGSRFIISYLYFYYKKSERVKNQKKLLIYGAGELGVFLKNSIHTHYKGEYKLVAFLDDDKQKIGRYIGGVKVVSAAVDMNEFINRHQISDIILANKTIAPARKSAFLEKVLPSQVRIREISSIQSFFTTKFNLDKLANIDIHDLMNREPIELYDEHVAENLQNKTILVTGAAGSIGSEIVRKLSEHGASLIICVDFSESALYDLEQELKGKYPDNNYHYIVNDIRNHQLLELLFAEFKPDYVYHAAAYKHVPLMEQFP
jgi:FlaA1/EpsC-like NDP-sugar epimerase